MKDTNRATFGDLTVGQKFGMSYAPSVVFVKWSARKAQRQGRTDAFFLMPSAAVIADPTPEWAKESR